MCDTDIQLPPTLLLNDNDKIYKVCENEDITFTIKLSGVPTPEAEWYQSKTVIKKSKKFVPTIDEQSATLTIKKVVDADAGSYTIKLKNACGEVEADLTLIIMREYLICLCPNVDLSSYSSLLL